MKKSLLVLTAALTFGGLASAQTTATSSAAQVPTLTDVPAGHWAKDAIDKLVSKGIILGYPDGTFRGTQNLTRYEAAVIIARLLDQMAQGQVPAGSIDPETLASLQNAIQELAADLAALGVRVTDLEENAVTRDDFNALQDKVDMLGAATGVDPEAMAALQAQLDDLTSRADDYDTLRADVDDNASSIAALNDLTVLLNQDILDLQDRVSAVEAAQADFVQRADFDALSGKVGAIDTRVAKLEGAPKFSVTGTITAAYGRIALTSGTTNFDVTRLNTGTFMDGVFDVNDGASVSDASEMPYAYPGDVRFGIKATNLSTTNGLITVNNGAINFRLNPTAIWDRSQGNIYPRIEDASADGTINGQKFDVKYSARFNDFKFQDYLFWNDNANANRRGAVINIDATKLPGAPKLTIVAGNSTDAVLSGGNFWGVRGAYKLGMGDLGLAYAQADTKYSAWGTNYNFNFGPVNLLGEGVISTPVAWNLGSNSFTTVWNNTARAFYTEARADLGIAKFGANYRTVSPEFAGGKAGLSANIADGSNSLPYAADQTGFGAALGTNISVLAVGAYVDSHTNYLSTSSRELGFGAKAGAKLGAFELVGFGNRFTVANVLNDGVNAPSTTLSTDGKYTGSDFNGNDHAAGMGIADVPFAMTSTLGAQAKHDGAASNALVKNLNFTVGDAYFYQSKTNSLYLYGDYSNTLGGFSINPVFRYRLVTNTSLKDGDHNFNVLKYGVKVSSPVLTGVPLQPSLYFNFANRISSTGSTPNPTGATSTTELFGQVGVAFDQFIVNGVSAKVGYSYYQGFNVAHVNVGDGANVFNASNDTLYDVRTVGTTASASKLDGLNAQIGWSGLTANWGMYRYYDLTGGANPKNPTSVAQAFKVSYTFKF